MPTQEQLDELKATSISMMMPMWLFDEGWVAPALRLLTEYYPDNVVAYSEVYRDGTCDVKLVQPEQRIPEDYTPRKRYR